jgi:hypothetical protein
MVLSRGVETRAMVLKGTTYPVMAPADPLMVGTHTRYEVQCVANEARTY